MEENVRQYTIQESSRVYEDFATQILYKFGMSVNKFSSQEYNIKYGEGIGRIEIKNDTNCTMLGNLYIEIAEKDRNGNYVPSGIYRNDNTIFWFIGNYEKAWLLVKEQLKWLVENRKKYKFNEKGTGTSIGVVIPIESIKQFPIPLIIKEFNFKKEEK